MTESYHPMPPEGMKEVTQGEFLAALSADRRDIMPQHSEPYFTTWEVVSGRKVWGWSYPGWKNAGKEKRYALAEVQPCA